MQLLLNRCLHGLSSISLYYRTSSNHLIGTDAFQECDTTGITRPCTKHNWLVKDINDLSEIMHKAFEVATTGRPGPVLVEFQRTYNFKRQNIEIIKKLKN